MLSVNNTTVKTAPKGALDQLGHALGRIIHAFAETADTADVKIFMANKPIRPAALLTRTDRQSAQYIIIAMFVHM